jgi:hypothetical protein
LPTCFENPQENQANIEEEWFDKKSNEILMSTIIREKMLYADRFAVQQADQAIRRDVVRALVELITNSNDSYNRIQDSGMAASGKIKITLQRMRSNSVLQVYDNAEGMAPEDLDNKVMVYGGATSGFKEGRSVRGLWGRGLKDSFFGLGTGYVNSIRDGLFNRCSLSVVHGVPTYQREKGSRATRTIRKQYEIPDGNGTVMEITVSRNDVRVPQFDSLRRNLERHFELRAIMSNPKRTVLLREADRGGDIEREVQLSYKAPIGNEILNETIPVPGYDVEATLHVFRASEPLSTPAEEGDCADGGLLIISKGVVLELTLLKFDYNEHASRFYGEVSCDHIHKLLKSDDSVLTATRDGINWRHAFAKALKEAVEKRLEPLVEEERKRAQAEQSTRLNKKLRERLNNALQELNCIASIELGKMMGLGEGPGQHGGKPPFVPASGFGFVPEYAYIQTGKVAIINLRASVPDKIEAGSLATVESNNPEVRVLTPQVRIDLLEEYTGIGEAKVELEGRQVGAEAIISASINGLKAEAMVKVISKREPPGPPPTKKEHGGLFRDVKFDPTAEPKQRVRFDQANANIVVATKAPSVAPYLDEQGRGSETPQGQVLLAELVAEAVCFEIARRGVQNGVFLAPAGAEADAIRREHVNLQNKYAHRIHECFVEEKYRRIDGQPSSRKGRPSREASTATAVFST